MLAEFDKRVLMLAELDTRVVMFAVFDKRVLMLAELLFKDSDTTVLPTTLPEISACMTPVELLLLPVNNSPPRIKLSSVRVLKIALLLDRMPFNCM